MKIYIIRHGETTGDVENRYGGDYDDHLTEKGMDQSRQLADKLKGKGIQIIYHSSRIRATETAHVLGNALGAELKVVDDIRERNNYGILTGMIKSEAIEKYPEEAEKLMADKLHHNVKGSENYESFKRRVIGAFEKILSNDSYGTIAIISHSGPINCFVREYLKLGEFKQLGDCGFLEIEKNDTGPSLVLLDNASLEKGQPNPSKPNE